MSKNKDESCPNCGYCPTCGRSAKDYNRPVVYPWPYYPWNPYYQYPTITYGTNTSANITTTYETTDG